MTRLRSTLLGIALLALAALCAVFPAAAWAHQTAAATYVAHVVPEDRRVDQLFTMATKDLASELRLDRDGDEEFSAAELAQGWRRIESYLARNMSVLNGGVECPTYETRLGSPETSQKTLVYMQASRCPKPLGAVALRNKIMLDSKGGFRTVGKIQLGEQVHATVFTPGRADFEVQVAQPGAAEPATEPTSDATFADAFGRFLLQGIEHILLGFDHVLFVLTLVLLARTFRRLALYVTGFTLGHSVTLAASALNVFTIAPAIVEPLIALSILYAAVEAGLREDEPKYFGVTTALFGLIHGFGFSYVLRDELGLPAGAQLPALLGFNLGVEIGQIVVVSLAFPLLLWLRKREKDRTVVRVAAALIGVLALYWLVERGLLAPLGWI